MDPALWEELARIGNRGAAVEAIVRLDRPNVEIPGLRLVARFGQIATCRIAVERIPQVYNDPRVLSLKASRLVGPERAPLCHGKPIVGLTPTRTDRCGPADRRLTGQGVVVGVIDTGCDVDHPSFKWLDGSSRLLALWDQRDREAGLELAPYGYGIRFGRADINRALRSGRPYEVLGYHPADADRDGMGAHGTHVMDISGGPIGAAGADLVFVHLANRWGNALAGDDLTSLGDSCRLLEAIDWVSRTAGRRPCVINISQGRHGGPHDGSTLVELAVSQWLQATPGRFVVFSAGNYASSRTHSSGNVTPGLARTLTFTTDPADLTPNEIELWYSGEDELLLGLETPSGHRTPLVPLGSRAEVHEQGRVVGRIYHLRDRNNGEHMVDLFLDPSAPAGHWRLTLHPVRIRNGRFDAWIERDEACKPCQARFVDSDVDPFCTLGTLANSHGPQLIVGAYDAHTPGWPVADFSSWGPTRDGRLKPDLLAPGVDVLAAWSAPRGSMRSPGELVRRSGTSMAAPAVTSAVALCLGAFGRRLDADELRDLILRNTRRPTAPDEIPARLGHGYLDLARLTDDILTQIRPGACRAGVRETMWPRRDPKEPSMARATDPTDVQEFDPDRLYRELTYSQDSSPARLDAMFVPLARPGERPSEPPQAGDVLVRVALGEPGRGHVAILSDGHLTPHTALGPVRAERGGSGYYAEVTDGPRCHAHPDPVWRRVLDTAGRLPPGQLLLRPRAQPASEPGEEEQNPVHDPMVEGPPMGEPETVQGTETGLEEQEVPAIDRRQTTSWAIASVGGGGFIVGYSLFLLVNRETGREHQIHIPTGGLSTYFGGASASSPSYTTFETRRPVSFADFDGVGVRLTTANLGVIFGYSIVYLTLWDGPAYASDRLAYIKMSGWGAMIPGGAVAHGVTKITYGSGARSGVVPLVFAPQPDDTVREPALTRIRLAARESPRIALPNEMLFDFDSVEIKPAAHTALLYLADLLNNRKRLPVEIEGHTDSTGGSKYNLALSARRAEAVKRWFVDRGVHGAADFRVVPYGEARPVATNTTAEGRRKNRRVVIKAAWGL